MARIVLAACNDFAGNFIVVESNIEINSIPTGKSAACDLLV